jgi:hypothetical protein
MFEHMISLAEFENVFACWFHKTGKRMPGEYLRKRKCGDEMKGIAVLTNGDDAPGMNAAIA